MSALKLKKLTAIIASSFCLWNIDITSANAAQLSFLNNTNKTATDFHIKFTLEAFGEVSETVEAPNFPPINPGGFYTYKFPASFNPEKDFFISAEWSFADAKNEPVEPVDPALIVPEPATIFGSALALGVGGLVKRKKSSQQNKITSQK